MKGIGSVILVAAIVCSGMLAALLTVSDGVRADTYKANVLVNDMTFGSQSWPKCAIDSSGAMQVVWVDTRDTSPFGRIRYAYSSNNATSFLTPSIRVVPEAQVTGSQANPDVAIQNGTTIAVWQENVGGYWDVKAAARNGTASAFSQPITVNAWTNDSQEMPSVSNGGGRTAVVWRDGRSDNLVLITNANTGAVVWSLAHTATVTSVTFSPTGDRVAAAAEDGSVRIWSMATGALVRTLRDHTQRATSVSWSPDGSRLATAGWDFTVRIYDGATYAPASVLSNSENPINSMSWSPDGARLAVGHNGEGVYTGWSTPGFPEYRFNLTLWYLNGTLWEWGFVGTHNAPINGVEFSPDGKWVATGAGFPPGEGASMDNTVGIWNSTSGLLANIVPLGSCVNSISWWSDSVNMTAGLFNGTAPQFDAMNDLVHAWLVGHGGSVRAVDKSPAGESVATGSIDTTAKVWNATSGIATQNITSHATTVHTVAWSPDGALVASGSGNSLQYRRNEYHIYCAVSSDAANTFPVQKRVTKIGSMFTASPRVSVSGNGKIGVVWYDNHEGFFDIYYSSSVDGGLSFSDAVSAANGAVYSASMRYNPDVALDDGGVAHVAWHDGRGKVAFDERYDIYYSNSTNFSSTLAVSPTANYMNQSDPSISVSPNGANVYIAWREIGMQSDIKVGKSVNSGATWLAPDTVSDVAGGSKERPSAALLGSEMYVCWQDTRLGSADIFASTSAGPDTWPPSLTSHYPSTGESGVSVFTSINLLFSEPVNASTVGPRFALSGGGQVWNETNCAFAWSAYGDYVSITPNSSLKYSEAYSVIVKAGVSDLSGNPSASDAAWGFTTGSDVDAPRLSHNQRYLQVSYDQTLTLTVEAIETTGLSYVNAHTKGVADSTFSAHNMSYLAGNTWTYTVPEQGALGTIQYYFQSADANGYTSTLPENLSAVAPYSVAVIDPYVPVISHAPLAQARIMSPIQVRGNISDGIGVQSAFLYYKGSQSLGYSAIAMDRESGDAKNGSYLATIPQQTAVGVIRYYIWANDTSNNTAQTTAADIAVSDSTPPTFLGEPTLQILDDGSIEIRVNVTDDNGMARVILHFLPVGGSGYIEKEMTGVGGTEYSAHILAQVRTGDFRYYIEAFDVSGNMNSTKGMNGGEPYTVHMEGSTPAPEYIILAVAIVVIIGSLVALALIIRARRRKGGSAREDATPLKDSAADGQAASRPGGGDGTVSEDPSTNRDMPGKKG